jgi:hypothetical protein
MPLFPQISPVELKSYGLETAYPRLDRSNEWAFLNCMKEVFGLAFIVLACCVADRALAQGQQSAPKGFVTSTNAAPLQQTSSVTLHEPATMGLRLTEPTDTNSFEYLVSKTTKVRVSGPIVQPLKAKTGADLSHSVLHLFSPFAKEQPAWQTAPSGPVNTRAWSTIAGWNPGRSAIPDETWHEPPHLNLISINVEKQPVLAEDAK